jgi:TM2 domain-containing membrane protein YozV
MKYISMFAMLLFIFSLNSIAQQRYEEVVYLKNGSIIRGTVIEQVPNVSLKIQTKDGNVFVYKMEEVEKITKEVAQNNFNNEYNETNSNYSGSEKSPALAVLLSAMIPGIGQYYNGDVTKGVIMNGLYIGGWVVFFTAAYETYDDYNYYYYGGYNYSYYNYYEKETAWLYVGLGVALGTSIWSMIDAGVSASNYNDDLRKSKQQRFGHMYENNLNEKVVLGIDFAPRIKGFSGGITLHF